MVSKTKTSKKEQQKRNSANLSRYSRKRSQQTLNSFSLEAVMKVSLLFKGLGNWLIEPFFGGGKTNCLGSEADVPSSFHAISDGITYFSYRARMMLSDIKPVEKLGSNYVISDIDRYTKRFVGSKNYENGTLVPQSL